MTPLNILTITLMVVGSFLVWKCRPLTAVCVYIGFILLYPQEWIIKFGGMPTLFVGKVLIFPLMLNLIFKAKRLSGFKLNVLDGAIVLLFLGQFIAGMTQEGDLWQAVADQSDLVVTETLNYFAIRFSIRSRKDLFFLIKVLVLIAMPLVFISFYESITGVFVYNKLHNLLSGQISALELLGPERLGFYRGRASFHVAISLGLFFAACVPLVLCLWNDPSWKRWHMIVAMILLSLGGLSTVSSTPLFSFAISAMVIAYYKLRKSLPLALPLVVIIVVFWQLLGPSWGVAAPTEQLRQLAFNPENADYRMELVEEAFTGGMDGHWHFGYGLNIGFNAKNPNPEFNWEHNDIVNIYVAQLTYFGLFGLIPYLFVSLLPFFKLYQAARVKRYSSDTWLIWCIFAFFAGWQVAFLTVSSIEQIRCLLYLLTGMISNLPSMVAREDSDIEQQKLSR